MWSFRPSARPAAFLHSWIFSRYPDLESLRSAAHPSSMSTKQIVRDLLEKLPEDATLHEVAQEIEFVAAVRQGLDEIERGERIPIEEVEGELPSWVIK
jgi:predicted transcriptional regulator